MIGRPCRRRPATNQTLGRVHGDRAHGVLTQMLRHFQNQAVAVVVGFQRVQNRRQIAIELNVDDGTDDLSDLAGCCADFALLLAAAFCRCFLGAAAFAWLLYLFVPTVANSN